MLAIAMKRDDFFCFTFVSVFFCFKDICSKIFSYIRNFSLVLILLLSLVQTDSYAVPIKANRRKSALEFDWKIGLSTFFDYKSNGNAIALFPNIGITVKRNFTDSLFFYFKGFAGTPFIGLGSESSGAFGFGAFVDFIGGREFKMTDKTYMYVAGGVNLRYFDMYNGQSGSLNANANFAGAPFLALGLNFDINNKNKVELRSSFGAGGMGVMFDGLSEGVTPALYLFAAFLFEHKIKIKDRSHFLWFVEFTLPFGKTFDSATKVQYQNQWFNQMFANVGIGFSFDI